MFLFMGNLQLLIGLQLLLSGHHLLLLCSICPLFLSISYCVGCC